jgi:uncharacterized membrane protein
MKRIYAKLGTAQKVGLCVGSLMGFRAVIWMGVSPSLFGVMCLPIIFTVFAAFGYALGWSIIAIAIAFGSQSKTDHPRIKQKILPAVILIGLALLSSLVISFISRHVRQ